MHGSTVNYKYSLLMHGIKMEVFAKFILIVKIIHSGMHVSYYILYSNIHVFIIHLVYACASP